MPLTTAGTPDIDSQRCKGCGLCVEFCPFGRLVLDTEMNQAGYHPAVVADRSSGGNASRRSGPSTGLPCGDEHPAEDLLAHNVAFWCPRCRYCELICPDAAVRIPGPTDGLEGVAGTNGTDRTAGTRAADPGQSAAAAPRAGARSGAGLRTPRQGGST